MSLILILVFLMIPASIIYMVYRYISGKQMTATADMFQQRDVIVNYKAEAIRIKGHQYAVSQVTGISTVTESRGRRNAYYIQIEVDDMRKPVHKVAVIGSRSDADEFCQRICVAIRKAGGPDFY
jgi:hypothetical protein